MKLIAILLSLTLLVSCVNHKSLKEARRVKVGMSTSELVGIMGEPICIDVNGDNEEWYFKYDYNNYTETMVVYVKENKIEDLSSY